MATEAPAEMSGLRAFALGSALNIQIVCRDQTHADLVVPLAHKLSGPRIHKMLREGLREGGDKVRTKVRRALKVQMGVKRYGIIVSNTIGVLGSAGALLYIIRGTGKGLPITDFSVSGRAGMGYVRWSRRLHWKLQARDAGGRFGKIADVPPEVTAAPWNISRTFKRSFVDPAKGYRAAIPGGSRVRIRKLFGPSVAKEIVKDQASAAFTTGVRVDVVPAIEKRLARLL